MAADFSEQEKLAFFQELVSVGTNIWLWQYGQDGHLSQTNSDHLVLDRFFENSGCKVYMLEHAGEYTAPMILSGPMGLMWSAVICRQNGLPYSFYVMGPVFNSELSDKSMEEYARQYQVDLSWRKYFISILEGLPVLSSTLFFQYTLMLHYCVNGEKLERSSLHFQKSGSRDGDFSGQTPQGKRMQTYLAERELLSMVFDGNINYQKALRRAGLLSSGVRVSGKNPSLQALISAATFTALCAREAIQAGISPDTAYSVGDHYIQSMIDSQNVSEIVALNHAMYEDFIQRVHKHRRNPKVSNHIQTCIDYIELHPEEPLSLGILAQRTGYSEYHLSRKFRQEMGVTISQYVQCVRVEQAKRYLTFTEETVAQIADRLQFSSSSHFSSVFQEVTGKKPSQYREENRKI